jgi:hypothetical protein
MFLENYDPKEVSIPETIKPNDKFIVTIGIKEFELTGEEYSNIYAMFAKNMRGIFFIERTGEFIDLKNFVCAKKIKEQEVFGENIKI